MVLLNEPEDYLRITLARAQNDPPVHSSEYQKELARFVESLQTQGVWVNPRLRFHDAAGAQALYLGELMIKLAPAIGPILALILGAWLKGRNGRKARLQIGNVKAEAQTVEDVEKLIKRAEEFQKAKRQARKT